MRILISADLHYDVARSRDAARQLAAGACRQGGDALVLLGDTAGRDLEPWRRCLELFAPFSGVKLLVPGNHCLWCRRGETSIERYERILPAVVAEAGFRLLDHEPQILDGVGLAGSVGWYDYAFRDAGLAIPLPFYQAKVAPGAAARLERHRHLVSAHADELTDRQLAIMSRWMDGQYVRLGMDDEQFTELLTGKLARQLEQLAGRVGRIAAFLHHAPFEELVPRSRSDRLAFAAAFMGAPRLGQALLACRKVTDVYCGHVHWPARHRIGRCNVVSIGSTYVAKRLETLELTETHSRTAEP